MESNVDIVIKSLEKSLLTQDRASHSMQFIYAQTGPGRRALFAKVEPLSVGGSLSVTEHFRKLGYDAFIEGNGSFVTVSKPGAKPIQDHPFKDDFEGEDFENEDYLGCPPSPTFEDLFLDCEAYSPFLRNVLRDSMYEGDFEGEPPYSRQECLAALQRAVLRDSKIPPEQRDGYGVPPYGLVGDALDTLRTMGLPSATVDDREEGFIFMKYTADGVPEYKTRGGTFTQRLEDPTIQVYRCEYWRYLSVNGQPPRGWIWVAYCKTSKMEVMLSRVG